MAARIVALILKVLTSFGATDICSWSVPIDCYGYIDQEAQYTAAGIEAIERYLHDVATSGGQHG